MCASDIDRALLLDLLGSLVGARSVNPPGNERLAAEVLASHLAESRVPAEVSEFGPGRANLVARLGDRSKGPSIALCSHLDVVPPGPGWTTEPFTLQVGEGHVAGRGVCDAKGPLAAMARAFCRLAEREGAGLRGEVLLAAVGGEEQGALGAKALVEGGLRADAVVVGEPTALRVCTAHMGRIEFEICLRGRGGHAAAVQSLDSPIGRLAEVIQRLVRHGEDLAHRCHPLLGPPTLAITSIEAVGITSTSVPGEARLVVDRRLIPGEDHAAASAEITAVLKGVTGLTCVAKNGALPAEQVVDDPLVVSANEALGADAEAIQGFRATCDQYVFAAVGSSVIVLGPGDLQVNRAHGPDETMLIADLVQASEVYERLVRGYLGASDTNGGG